jgi:hypothetical protein
MPPTLDDDSVPANARAWDFVMPPKSCSTLPLSSENWADNLRKLQKTNLPERKMRVIGRARPPGAPNSTDGPAVRPYHL